jgi:hypothetical protein
MSTETSRMRAGRIVLTRKLRCLIMCGTMPASRGSRHPLSPRLRLLVCLLLLAPGVAVSDDYDFTVIPADVAGTPGSTVGWNYSITNNSATDWLVLTTLNAGTFDHGTPTTLFDFPIVAPDTRVSQTFDPSLLTGLYELTWDSTAPVGFVNRGVFDVSGEWWTDDPLAGGIFLSDAADKTAAYSAAVTGVPGVPALPEPATGLVLPLVVAFMLLHKTKQNDGSRRRGEIRVR